MFNVINFLSAMWVILLVPSAVLFAVAEMAHRAPEWVVKWCIGYILYSIFLAFLWSVNIAYYIATRN